MAGLTVVLSKAARNMNRNASPVRSKAFNPLAKRQTSHVPSSASEVFPTAMPRDTGKDPWVVRLTKKAPKKTAGQRRRPRHRSTAKASPVGGQTGEALALKKA